MTHRRIRTLDDGTRVYSNYTRYAPKPVAERAYGVRRPTDPRAVRFHGQWLLPLEVLTDDNRVMPETRPDDQAYAHMDVTALCRCRVCMRPEAARWRRKWRKDHGLRPGPAGKNPAR